MTLPHYYRTAKGNWVLEHRALENRPVKLTSRQRALLLMIENGQNSHLSQQQLYQLATPDNLAVLLEHQLIAAPDDIPPVIPQILTRNTQPASAIKPEPIPVLTQHTEIDEGLIQTARHLSNPQPSHEATHQVSLSHQQPVIPNLEANAIADLAGQHIVISDDLQSVTTQHSAPVYLSFDEVKQLMMDSLREYCGLLASALIKEIQHASSITKLRLCQMRWVTTLTETRASSAQIKLWVEQINYSLHCASVADSPSSRAEALTL